MLCLCWGTSHAPCSLIQSKVTRAPATHTQRWRGASSHSWELNLSEPQLIISNSGFSWNQLSYKLGPEVTEGNNFIFTQPRGSPQPKPQLSELSKHSKKYSSLMQKTSIKSQVLSCCIVKYHSMQKLCCWTTCTRQTVTMSLNFVLTLLQSCKDVNKCWHVGALCVIQPLMQLSSASH